MKNSFKLGMIAVICTVVFIAGCGKTDYSLLGVWSLNSIHLIAKQNNVTVVDTVENQPSGGTITFATGNHYETYSGPGSTPRGGTFAQNSDRVLLYDSAGQPNGTFYIHGLTDHALTLERRDTSTTPVLTTYQYFYGLSK